MLIVLARSGECVVATRVDDDGAILGSEDVEDLAGFVRTEEPRRPRWVWDDTSRWYSLLLAARLRIERCFDLRLCHAILRNSAVTSGSVLATAEPGEWDVAAADPSAASDGALFELAEDGEHDRDPDPLAEYLLQHEAVVTSAEPARISRLLAAESAGALIAAEMRHAGLPWRADAHDAILTGLLGPRPAVDGERPAKLQDLLSQVRDALHSPDLNPDSPADLLGALRRAGVAATSTRSWELRGLVHPAIEPLLEYKKLARLLSANGWHWLDTWVEDGRFRPDYVPGGVVTGRWATSGGGALQLPRQVRGAVIADDGWKLVVADASQLEPRILAAMAADRAMIEAGAAGDLYAGIVASGAVRTRAQAKVTMLGAMYGATRGESGRLMPSLARAYPNAIGMVEDAARAGERGEVVSTRLGRGSPRPGEAWRGIQAEARTEGATEAAARRARNEAQSWGRFTRNFIVQGTAAEWALCWMASVRRRLIALGAGAWLTDSPHLVFFLHDEIVVHSPDVLADRVAAEITAASAEAGRLLFGDLPAQFPVTVAVVDDYGQAK